MCHSLGKWTWERPAACWKSHISSRRMPARTSVWLKTPGEWTQWKESSLSTVGDPVVHEYLTTVHHICQTCSDWKAAKADTTFSRKAGCGDQQRLGVACARKEVCFNGTSKWLKAISHDASNILIQIKEWCGWGWALGYDLVGEPRIGFPPDGIVIHVQLDRRSKLLNVLYIDQWHICQGLNLHSSIWINGKGVRRFQSLLLTVSQLMPHPLSSDSRSRDYQRLFNSKIKHPLWETLSASNTHISTF